MIVEDMGSEVELNYILRSILGGEREYVTNSRR